MTTKLVSANMGIILVVEQDGEEKTVQFSTTFPKNGYSQPSLSLGDLIEFVNEVLGTDYTLDSYDGIQVQIAKPKRIKAPRPVSQDAFNKRIKELGYKP